MLEGRQRLFGVHQVAVGIVLDQHRVVLGAQRHQPRLVGVGHDAAQRIVQVGHDDQRLDPFGALQQLFKGWQINSDEGRGRDFQHPQVQAFEDLQQAIEGG
ncbi:hypothetical protein D3C76_990870 [compost metagenome]